MIRAIRKVLTIQRKWDRSRACTTILRFAVLLLLLAFPLNSFAQAHLLTQRPFRATEDQRSGGDHICDLRSDSNGDGRPGRLGDYVCISGTVIAGPQTYKLEGSFFQIQNRRCGMLVCGGAEPLRVGDSVAVGGHLYRAGRGELSRNCRLQSVRGCAVGNASTELGGVIPETHPLPVALSDYCSNPAAYAGNLIEVYGISCISSPVADGENLFCWAGNGGDSLVLFIDGDTGIELSAADCRTHTITGITMRMHVPENISTAPRWCLAPRSKADVAAHDCSTAAAHTTLGAIKARFSD